MATMLVAACATAPAPTERTPFEPALLARLDADDFPGAAKVLAGFAPPDDDPNMRVGDAALLGVEFVDGDTVERLMLHLEVTSLLLDAALHKDTGASFRPSFTASSTVRTMDPATRTLGPPEPHEVEVHPVRVALTRLDAQGQPQQVSEAILFEEALAVGLWPHIERAAATRDRDLAGVMTRTLQGLVNDDAVLQDLLFHIVEKPSLWSIATNLGVSVTLVWMNFAEPESITLSGIDTPIRRLPLEVNVNTDPGLWVDLAVAKPVGATRACGGLIGAIARHPRDARRYAVVRLLAARRGPALAGT